MAPAYEKGTDSAYRNCSAPRSLTYALALVEAYSILGVCLAAGIVIGTLTQDKGWPRVISILVYFLMIFGVFCLVTVYGVR